MRADTQSARTRDSAGIRVLSPLLCCCGCVLTDAGIHHDRAYTSGKRSLTTLLVYPSPLHPISSAFASSGLLEVEGEQYYQYRQGYLLDRTALVALIAPIATVSQMRSNTFAWAFYLGTLVSMQHTARLHQLRPVLLPGGSGGDVRGGQHWHPAKHGVYVCGRSQGKPAGRLRDNTRWEVAPWRPLGQEAAGHEQTVAREQPWHRWL